MYSFCQVYWEFSISGTCAYVGVGKQLYSIASCPGLGEESWAIGDSGFGAELLHNATVELNVDLSGETGAMSLGLPCESIHLDPVQLVPNFTRVRLINPVVRMLGGLVPIEPKYEDEVRAAMHVRPDAGS